MDNDFVEKPPTWPNKSKHVPSNHDLDPHHQNYHHGAQNSKAVSP